jgi:cation:H+ antiporter
MDLILHLIIFLIASGAIWYFAGFLIDAVGDLSQGSRRHNFLVAFFVLGLLTSVGELSVAVNAVALGLPAVSAGNLIGASIFLLLFIIPFLAAAGRGLTVDQILPRRIFIFTLVVIFAPVLLVLDGVVSGGDGLLALLLYVALLLALIREPELMRRPASDPEQEARSLGRIARSLFSILIGALLIFVAGDILVDEASFFAERLSIPSSIIGLVLLSIGTNIPEIVIAVRAIWRRQSDIAFGDYLGSAVANTPIFSLLAIGAAPFAFWAPGIYLTTVIFGAGLVLFYFFIQSKRHLSRAEGAILLGLYFIFLTVQIYLTAI